MNEPLPSGPEDFVDPLSDYEPTEYPSEMHRVLAEESCLSIQTTPCTMIDGSLSIGQATEKLAELKVSSLLVVEKNKLVGIFTERDVLEKVAERYSELADRPVRDVMTSDPSVIYETDPVGAAVGAIAVAGHRHVPVLGVDGDVIGIVSPKRVLRFLDPFVGAS